MAHIIDNITSEGLVDTLAFLVGSSTTLIPTTTPLRINCKMEKSTSSTTARLANVDYVYWKLER